MQSYSYIIKCLKCQNTFYGHCIYTDVPYWMIFQHDSSFNSLSAPKICNIATFGKSNLT